MKKITVFGAAGKAGQRLVAEALARGHELSAVLRDPGKSALIPSGVKIEIGDATEALNLASLIQGRDALILTIGGTAPGLWRRAAANLVGHLEGLVEPWPRLIHLGGGASLIAPDGKRYVDHADFPVAILENAKGQAEALDYYLGLRDPRVDWTYISPPPRNFAPGKRLGHYRWGRDEAVFDASGNTSLSYEDMAVAIVDEIEKGDFHRMRVTLGY